ncbi:MAG: peptidoglycan-binding protein [Deltaproteobacteria bacterium]|nr:peptidoglycan-binding protein [Deltaproteobacteria bacterium]
MFSMMDDGNVLRFRSSELGVLDESYRFLLPPDLPGSAGFVYRSSGDFRRPPGVSLRARHVRRIVFKIEEYRWCLQQAVRTDVLTRFTPEGGDLGPARTAFGLFQEWCNGMDRNEARTWAGLLGEGRDAGIQVVGDALEAAKAWNPGLEMRPMQSGWLRPGMSPPVPLGEAQRILQVLELDPGRTDGTFDAGTSEALKKFQTAVGFPADGNYGQRTGTLLRNSLFLHSLYPYR